MTNPKQPWENAWANTQPLMSSATPEPGEWAARMCREKFREGYLAALPVAEGSTWAHRTHGMMATVEQVTGESIHLRWEDGERRAWPEWRFREHFRRTTGPSEAEDCADCVITSGCKRVHELVTELEAVKRERDGMRARAARQCSCHGDADGCLSNCDYDECRCIAALLRERAAARAELAKAAAVTEAARAAVAWYDRDGSVGMISEVFEGLKAALAVVDGKASEPLSPEAQAALDTGLKDAREGRVQPWGDFRQYWNDDEVKGGG